MRRARRRKGRYGPTESPFAAQVTRDACYQVSPYQEICWREAWDGLPKEQRWEMTSKCQIPGLLTTFGAEIVHRLSADPVRVVSHPGPGAAFRQRLHLMMGDSLVQAARRCRFQPKLAATIAIEVVREMVNRISLSERPTDTERLATERQAAEDLGLTQGPSPTPATSAADQDRLLRQLDAHSNLGAAVQATVKDKVPPGMPNMWTPTLGGVGGDGEGGGGSNEPHSSRPLTLAAMLESHPEIKRVLTLAGRLLPVIDRLADDKRSKRGAGRSRLESTTEIPRLTTLERASLAGIRGGIVAADTFRRVLEGSALGYQGDDPRGEGPLIVCLDQSGSMFDYDGYDEEGRSIRLTQDWAQAVALTLMLRAARTGRQVAIVPYDNHVRPETIRAFYKKPTNASAVEAIRVGENLQGGTSWFSGLTASLDLIQQARERGLGASDIVHITDGFPGGSERDPEAVVARAAAMNVRIHGIAVGHSAQRIAGNPESLLAKWSHTICAVSDTSHDSPAVQALGRI